jgi:hypothetical protein
MATNVTIAEDGGPVLLAQHLGTNGIASAFASLTSTASNGMTYIETYINGNLVQTGQTGSAGPNADYAFKVYYKPNPNAFGDFGTVAGTFVTDHGGIPETFSSIIHVTPVPDAPDNISISNSLFSENVVGAFVGTLSASDPDGPTTFNYQLFSDPSGLFEIRGADLFVKTGRAADFEARSSYDITVRVFDNTNRAFDKGFTIRVGNANETPTITSNGGNDTAVVSIQENTTSVTKVAGSDPDAGTTLGYSIVGGTDADKFLINASTGILSFKVAPNFEAPADSDHNNSYVVTVRASDGSLFDDQTITVNVTDAIEAAAGSVSINDMTITESNSGTKIANFTVTRSGGSSAFDVNFTTADGSGTVADHDYITNAGTLHFGAGVNTQTISVTINGDTKIESNETFSVTLSGATNGATISDNLGIGTIFDDDGNHSRDFNADGRSDILWQRADGQPAEWQMNGLTTTGTGLIGRNPGANMHEIASGDFNGDGRADILWQGTDGTPAMWLMNGTSIIGEGVIGRNPGPNMHAIATGDFNGDGNADILWQGTDGTPAVWLMNGMNVVSEGVIGRNPGPNMHAIATGDFNGDGYADILWQGTDGTPAMWLMKGMNIIGEGVIGRNPGPNMHAIATGDFNGDGHADILWQGTDGTPAMWLMNGMNIISEGVIGRNPGSTMHAVATGDFNNDHHSDILWHADDGTAAMWLMNGLNVTSEGVLGFNPGADWHIVA